MPQPEPAQSTVVVVGDDPVFPGALDRRLDGAGVAGRVTAARGVPLAPRQLRPVPSVMRRHVIELLSVLALGVLAAVLVAAASSRRPREVVVTGLLAAVGGLLAVLLVAVMLRRVRDRSSEVRSLTVALAALTALTDQLEAGAPRIDGCTTREHAIEASRRELVSWVAQEVRSRSARVQAMAATLDDRTTLSRESADHAQLRHDVERLGWLVEDLVELSQVAIGPELQDAPPTMLTGAVVDVIAGARAQAERRGVRFTDRVGELPEMELGGRELATALRDLLDDAIRRSSPGATVLVESFVDAGGVTVAVTDECGGPHERHLTRVFDVAYRSHPARSRGDDSPAVTEAPVGAHRCCVEEADSSPSCCFTVRLGRLA